jgi:hypothetical protein
MVTAQRQTLLAAHRTKPPPPAGPVLAIDGSNWTEYDYTDEVLSAWKAAGVGLIIEQAIAPPAGYPPGRTRQHIQACLSFGMPVAAYCFWWASAGTDYLKRQLDTLSGLESGLVRLWLDLEDSTLGRLGGDPGRILSHPLPVEHLRRIARQPRPHRDQDRLQRLAQSISAIQADIQSWHDVLDTLPAKNRVSGQYSSGWYTPSYVDLTPWSNRSWWNAAYDGIPDVNVGDRWGGHELPMTIKQFAGSSSLAGYGSVDLNVVSAQEAALFT